MTPATTDDLATMLYQQMKAPSPVRQLYAAMQAAEPDARVAVVSAAAPDLQRELAAYIQRRAQLVGEHAEFAECVHDREEWAAWFRRDPETRVPALKRFYRNAHIAEMIDDWGWTLAQKRANTGGAVRVPFRLFEHQVRYVDWLWKHYREGTPGVCAKAREVGCSWLTMAFAACMCVLFKDILIGVVASTEDKLDSAKDPSPTIPKAREFLSYIPEEFQAGYDGTQATANFLKVVFPATGSLIRGWTGTGDQGRGARAAMICIDEAAFFENPHALDASLSAASDCLIYISSAHGTGNPFFDKVSSGNYDTFWFRITDDPRRSAEWIAQKKKLLDPVIWASEYEISFTASVDFQLFNWDDVAAAIGLREFLEKRDGFKNPGNLSAALDLSDQGKDKNALSIARGIELEYLELWSGHGLDQGLTTQHAFSRIDEHAPGCRTLIYDASVAGAGLAGEARRLNTERAKRNARISIVPFVGATTEFPRPNERAPGTDRTWEDFAKNLKAYSYWMLSRRFIESAKARRGERYDRSLIISLSPKLANLVLLQNELAQIQRKQSLDDKLVIDKAAARPGQPRPKSPNCADSLAMLMGGGVKKPTGTNQVRLEMARKLGPGTFSGTHMQRW